MARQEHVHIISAGENIYPSYAATVRDYPDITQMFVFVDTELYTNSLRDEGAVREQKEAARKEVTKVKSLSATLSIPASLVYVVPPADVSARDAVMKIRKGHPDAKFSFDLTAGSKDLSMALFAISLWIGGNAFYAFGGRKNGAENAKLAVPKIPAVNVAATRTTSGSSRPLHAHRENRRLRAGCCPVIIFSPSWNPSMCRCGRRG